MKGLRKYFIVESGEQYPIKQVIEEITNVSQSDFIASDAYRSLLSLGNEIKNLEMKKWRALTRDTFWN